ncbi:MAG: VWA domain-containing protein [Geminicoccaceae bacterium]
MSDKPIKTDRKQQGDSIASQKGDLPSERQQQDPVQAFLNEVAKTPPPVAGSGRGRLIFAMDATASREPSWDQACQVQGQMFLETAALGGLDVQLMFYRGFNECKASRWVNNPSDLVTLMTSVFCLAGQTKIKRILQHAIKETNKKRVSALVFVGDAFEENLDEVGQIAGQLGLLGVRAFIFQEGHKPEASQAFRHIAKLTKGAHCQFDASSPDQLRELLGAVAAYAAGGRKALADLSKRSSQTVKLIASQVG